jgi:hypothetical protein
MNDFAMRRLILAVIGALMFAGLFAAAPAALARPASVCQPNGTGCAKAGNYSGLNALISSDYNGFQVVWTSSVVHPYSSGVPVLWTAYVTYTNIGSSPLDLGCPGAWPNASNVAGVMAGGSGDDGLVRAASTTCSQNPGLDVTVQPSRTFTAFATFQNVPWPGSTVTVEWGDAGSSPPVYPFVAAFPADPNGIWAGYVARTGDAATQVNGSFVVPKVTCAKGESSTSAFWVGISNSAGNGTIAQDGVSAFCYKGKPGYYLWWEAWGRPAAEGGANEVPVLNTNARGASVAPAVCRKPSLKLTGKQVPTLAELAFLVANKCLTPIKPGYDINLAVTVSPDSYAFFGGYVAQTHFELNTTQSFSNAAVGGAEWIVEHPTAFHDSGLSKFGEVTFTKCYVYAGDNGTPAQPVSAFRGLQLILDYDVSPLGPDFGYSTAAAPGPLSPVTSNGNGAQDGFNVTWYNRG